MWLEWERRGREAASTYKSFTELIKQSRLQLFPVLSLTHDAMGCSCSSKCWGIVEMGESQAPGRPRCSTAIKRIYLSVCCVETPLVLLGGQ